MICCYDTEFLDDGSTIEFISIGIVREDGSEYYAVNADMPTKRVYEHKWLKENVWPHLPIQWNGTYPTMYLDTHSALVKPKWVIANEVREFLLADGQVPELWAYCGAYDHVVLAQLFGPMNALPKGIPFWTHDLNHVLERVPGFVLSEIGEEKHNALVDARWLWRTLNDARDELAHRKVSG